MAEESEYLLLKWGTLKGWRFTKDGPASEAFKRYCESGETTISAMAQHDNTQQKFALCDIIDALEGEITNDWSGEVMTKDEAKDYVMNYGSD